MPKHVLFVHGYSETSLGAYSRFPALLGAAGLHVEPIVLSAFDSLDDQISIADLAAALDDHIVELEQSSALGWDTAGCAIICHSTGALVARRWMLDRAQRGDARIPSHLITMAGANHGSSLAQAGKSVLGYLQKLLLKHIIDVGARVLTDLDYGSDFLLRLNREWLLAANDDASPLSSVFSFSMGGDWYGGDAVMQVFWGTHEPGSDNTVRISAANLNYRLLDADVSGSTATLTPIVPKRPVPHIVLHGYSHFGEASGILGKAADASDPAFGRVLEALGVTTAAQYAALTDAWSAHTDAWANEPAPGRDGDVNATVVFSVFDRGGQAVDDCMIAFLDTARLTNAARPLDDRAAALAATAAVSPAVLAHSPIHNDVQRGSYSFYLNWPSWENADHLVHVEAHSPSRRITYHDLDYRVSPEIGKLVLPNQVTYVRLRLDRDTENAYALFGWTPTLDADLGRMTWGPDAPFPSQGRIPPLS